METIADFDEVVVVMHDNPDPDAIASAWCIVEIARASGFKNIRAIAGGAIVRAENSHMVRLLNPPIELVDATAIQKELSPAGERRLAAILVDCGAGAENHLVARLGLHLVGVIDHHLNHQNDKSKLAYSDVRPDVAACASITASYLMESKLKPSEELATAIWYALRTETCAFESTYSELDREVLVWSTTHGSPSLLAEIENAPLPPSYYADLSRAISKTRLDDSSAFCWLDEVKGVEIVGEMADLLIRCTEVNKACCVAKIADDIYLSVRTSPNGENATELVSRMLDGSGSCGGHRHRAGGKVCYLDLDTKNSQDPESHLFEMWRVAAKISNDETSEPISLLSKST